MNEQYKLRKEFNSQISDTEIETLNIYIDILNGKIKRFPHKFWENNPKEKARIMLKYLIEEILKWDSKEIIKNLNKGILTKYYLSSACNLYNSSLYDFISDIYPNRFKPWEIHAPKGYWSNIKNAIQAVKWLIEEKLKWSDEELKRNLKAEVFWIYGLRTMLEKCFNGSIYEAINTTYPNRFKPWEFGSVPKNFWTKEKAIEATRWLFEEELKWDIETIKKNANQEFFSQTRLYGMIQTIYNNSPYLALKDAYPNEDWEAVFRQYETKRFRK